MFAEDRELQGILSRSSIWATEEILLPTLVALLGHRSERGPSSYDYVLYRPPYEGPEIEAAMAREDVFWAHPVPRQYQDTFRAGIRARFDQYRCPRAAAPPRSQQPDSFDPSRLVAPVLQRMRGIDGWLEEDEAELLAMATHEVLSATPVGTAVVEVGSHLGRATTVLASVVQARDEGVRVHAIDPHEGHVGALDTGLVAAPSSPEALLANLRRAGVASCVAIHHARPAAVAWHEPIALLLVDGLHDYASTAQDFFRFEPFLPAGAVAAFHDYAEYFPGVVVFVDELIESGAWRRIGLVRSMIVLLRVAPPAASDAGVADAARRDVAA
jgi:hypothetical protein